MYFGLMLLTFCYYYSKLFLYKKGTSWLFWKKSETNWPNFFKYNFLGSEILLNQGDMSQFQRNGQGQNRETERGVEI